jgi:peptidyl-prolyl cis-trans isomerase B (cyclophilin B)
MTKRLVLGALLLILVVGTVSFARNKKEVEKKMANPVVVMKTSKGDIKIELFEKKAPITVGNFLQYVDDEFYNDTIFHRVISGFMIQGGGFDSNMEQKDTRSPIEIESDNGVRNDRGTIAMARTMDPNSATAQFFINLVDNDFLNFKSADIQGYGYAVFGKVIEGLDVVDEIASVKTGMAAGHQDVPEDDIVILSVSRDDN